MRLTADSLKRKAGVDRCACCGKILRPSDRIFYHEKRDVLWCSVKCAISDQLPLANIA